MYLLKISRHLLFVLFIGNACIPAPVWAQLINGSFETAGQPSLEGWSFFCDHDTVEDPAPGGGEWSLLLVAGSTQGCFSGFTEQTIGEIQSGEVWRAEAWVKNVSRTQYTAISSLYWKIIATDGTARKLSTDTSSVREWRLLTVEDTLVVADGEEVRLVLDGGLLGGPLTSSSRFDLVAIEKVDPTATNNAPLSVSSEDVSVHVFPNPVRSHATFRLHLNADTEARMVIYDILGREVATLLEGFRSAGIHDMQWTPTDLSKGTYFIRIQVAGRVEVRPFLLLGE